MTYHAENQIKAKGFSLDDIQAAFSSPEKVYPNGKYAGQYRVVGNSICLVGQPVGETFNVITVYEDGVLTPPRPEQLDTPEGRRYAERYNRGLARNNEYYPRIKARKAGSNA